MPPNATPQGSEQAADKNTIRPFRVNVPEAELTELRRRINNTQAPQGRALCGLGTAEALFRRGSRGLQIAAVVFFTREEKMRHA